MSDINQLLKNNQNWSKSIKEKEEDFFQNLSKLQSPKYLWIGCSDSRLPPNEILGLLPGELFVHRNIANVVVHTDFNCLSVIQYAVDVLKVEHIIICGHYGCGGVIAASREDTLGLIDNWLRHVGDVKIKYKKYLQQFQDEEEVIDHVCEFNVIEQVVNVCKTSLVQDAWARGQKLVVHGWIYNLADGLIQDLGVGVDSVASLQEAYENSLQKIDSKYFAKQGS